MVFDLSSNWQEKATFIKSSILNEMICVADIQNHMSNLRAKGFFDLNSDYQIFRKLPQISYIYKSFNVFFLFCHL